MRAFKRIIASLSAVVITFMTFAVPAAPVARAGVVEDVAHIYNESTLLKFILHYVLGKIGEAGGAAVGTITVPGIGTIEGTLVGAFVAELAGNGIDELAEYYAAGYTDEDFAEVYISSYGGGAGRESISSDDLTTGTAYNFSDCSGFYYSATSTQTSYSVGAFPYSYAYFEAESNGACSSSIHIENCSDLGLVSGAYVSITYYFPTVIYDIIATNPYLIFTLRMEGDKPSMNARVFRCSLYPDRSDLAPVLSNGSGSGFLAYPALFDSDYSASFLYDNSGSIIGVTVSGTLLSDLTKFYLFAGVYFDSSTGTNCTMDISYSSPNDLVISGGSGSSTTTDTADRIGLYMEELDEWNQSNLYQDNQYTPNYYITPDDGESLYSPAVFSESTKTFTEPVTGTQYLCEWWVYHYTEDNTLEVNGHEIDGNYLGSYILRLADSSYIINGTTVPAVWIVYMDDEIWVMPYYTDSDTGDIVPLDFQSYSYATVAQTDCGIGNHDMEWEVTEEPTCTSTGTETGTCSICGEVQTWTLDKLDHTYTYETVSEPTCGTPGERKYTCTVCGDEYAEDIPATGVHSYEYSVSQEPTCTAVGTALYTCSICGDEYTETLPALGHDWLATEFIETTYEVPEGTSCPECSSTAYTYTRSDTTFTCICSDCGTEWNVEANITHGRTTYTCSRCGETKIEGVSEELTQESWFTAFVSKFNWLTSISTIYKQLIADVTSDAATAAAVADGAVMLADVTSDHADTDSEAVTYTAPELAISFGSSDKYGVDWANIKPLDLSWYAPHKETVDGILSGILWLSYLFLLIKRAPGIIRGSEMVTEDRIKIDTWLSRH